MVMPAPPREPGWRPNPSGLAGLVLVLAVVIGVWWLSGGDPGTPTGTAGDPSSRVTPIEQETLPPSDEPSAPASASDSASDSASPDASSSPSQQAQPSGEGPQTGDFDPETGLTWVEVEDLPVEAEDTLERIDAGGPFRYSQDGATFQNREGILPDSPPGTFAEYTVETPGSPDRGARRIVTGYDDEYFWTEDHYDSFERIAR